MTLINFLTDGIRARDLRQYHADNNRGVVTVTDRGSYGLEDWRQVAGIIKTVAERIHNVVGKVANVDDPADDQQDFGRGHVEDADDHVVELSSPPRAAQNWGEQNPYRRTFEETGSYLVDQVVLVEGNAPQQRSANEEFWAFNRNIMILTGCLGVVGSAAGLVVSAVATSTVLVLAASVTAFVSPFFAALCFYRAYQAHDQMQQWSVSPAVTVANQRAAAYREGFFYAVDHNLRADPKNPSPDGVLHEVEVQYLYQEAFRRQQSVFEAASEFSAAGKEAVLNDFVQQSPLSQEALLFILPFETVFDDAPEHFRNNNAMYEKFCAKYTGFGAYADQKKLEIAGRHREVVAELDAQKEGHLTPFKARMESRRGTINDYFRPLLERLQIERQESGDALPLEEDYPTVRKSGSYAVASAYSPPPQQPSYDSGRMLFPLPVGVPAGSYVLQAAPYDGGMSSPPQAYGVPMARDGDDAGQIQDPIEQATSQWDQAVEELTRTYIRETAGIEKWYADEVQRLDAWKDAIILMDEPNDDCLGRYLRIATRIVDTANYNMRRPESSREREITDDDYDVIEINSFRIEHFSSWSSQY